MLFRGIGQRTLPLVCLFLLCFVQFAYGACSAGKPSGSAILQLVDISDFDCSLDYSISHNGVFALCGQSLKVTIDKKGAVILTSASTASYKYSGPGPDSGTFSCKAYNASGIAIGKAPKAANVTLVSDIGFLDPSSLKVVKGGFLNLTVANAYSYKSPPSLCWLKYKVTSGCVLGVKAPAKPYVCPPGTFIKKGKFGNYCALCLPGTASSKPNSKSCTPCKVGFESPNFGGKCTKCSPGTYSSKPGTASCAPCVSDATNEFYTNGVFCKKCPADSWASTSTPSQCVVCADGKKCCRVGAGPGCPACPKGFKSGKNATALLAYVSSSPAKCAVNQVAQCSSTIKISVDKTCRMYVDSSSPLDVLNVSTVCDNGFSGSFGTTIKGRTPQLRDIVPFFGYGGEAQPVTLKGKLLTLPHKYSSDFLGSGVSVAGTCKYTYRVLSVSSPNPFPFSTTPCTAGSPGCVSKAKPPTCGPGKYVRGTACLPCPPGQYKSGKSSATKCTACPAGSAALGYGNTKCNKCPPATSTAGNSGRSECVVCDLGSYSAVSGQATCTTCPPGTTNNFGPDATLCLGNNLGTICCGGGSCKGKIPDCPSLRADNPDVYSAVIQLVKKQAPARACENSTFITCQAVGAYNGMVTRDTGSINYDITPIGQPKCVEFGDSPLFSYVQSSGPNRGLSLLDPVYDVRAFASNKSIVFVDTTTKGKCWAVFKLVAGYAFSITPPSKPTCPKNAVTQTFGSRKFCAFCIAGQYSDGKTCKKCPKNSYSSVPGSTACTKCPAGRFTSDPGSSSCDICFSGSFLDVAKGECVECPANTFSDEDGVTKCKPCPKGLVSKQGARECTPK